MSVGCDGLKKGLLSTSIEKMFVYGVTFIQSIILARLLNPKDFGLCAMLGIFLGIGGVLADCGLSTLLVVKSRLSKRSERCAFVWCVAVSTALCMILMMIAPFVGKWFNEPLLAKMLCILSLSVTINSAGIVAVARLTRLQSFVKLSWLNGFSCIISSAIGVGLAYIGCGVWSIVSMMLLYGVVRTALAWFWAIRLPNIDSDREEEENNECSLWRLLSDGWKLTVSGLIHTAYCNLYQMIIGKLWSSVSVGLFVRGQRWSQIPGEVMNEAISRVALPNLASDISKARGFTHLNVRLLWPGLVVLWIFAEEVISTILGTQWIACVPYLKVLIVGQFFTPITNVALCVLKAMGRTDLILLSDAIKKPFGLSVLGIGCQYGVIGLCWAKVVNDIVECVTDLIFAVQSKRGKEPIDFVYCWCNGDIVKNREICRFENRNELYYSIMSLDRFAPWARKIYVLVNDGTEIPDWLKNHKKVQIVKHSDIIPSEILPLFNPVSIEFWLHRLPGLSERFVYGNDDMFLGRTVSPSDFFDRKGRMICRYKLCVSLKRIKNDFGTYNAQLRNCRKLLHFENDSLPHHCFDGYLKSVIEEFWKVYSNEALTSASFRERSEKQLCRDVFSIYAMRTGRAVLGKVKKYRFFWISLYAELCDAKAMNLIHRKRPKMFCLNDSENSKEDDRGRMVDFLKEMFEV